MIPATRPVSNLTFSIERFSDRLIEARGLAEAHWQEFGNHQDIRNLEMDYDKYLAADRRGMLKTCVARRAGKIVGYLVMFVIVDAHAKSGFMAESAFYYTVPIPTRGFILRGMIRTMCRNLLDSGVRYIRFRHRLRQTARPILENLGFELDELSFSLNVDKFRG